RNFKLPEYAAGFELSLDAMLELRGQTSRRYRPLSRYPSVERDISLKIASQVSYAELYAALEAAIRTIDIEVDMAPLGIYQPDDDATKTTTFRLVLTSHDKTLTSDEANQIIDTLVSRLVASVDAEIV